MNTEVRNAVQLVIENICKDYNMEDKKQEMMNRYIFNTYNDILEETLVDDYLDEEEEQLLNQLPSSPLPLVRETVEDYVDEEEPEEEKRELTPPLPPNLSRSPISPPKPKPEQRVDMTNVEAVMAEEQRLKEKIIAEDEEKELIQQLNEVHQNFHFEEGGNGPLKTTAEIIGEEVVEEEKPVYTEATLKKMKVGELKKLCKEKGLKKYSTLKKNQLVELLLQ